MWTLIFHTHSHFYRTTDVNASQPDGYVKAGETFGVEHHWSARLEREGLDYFRAYDCMNLKGEFRGKSVDRYGWTRPARQRAGRKRMGPVESL